MEFKSGQGIRLRIVSETRERKELIVPISVNRYGEVCAIFGNTSIELLAGRISLDLGDADLRYDGEMNGAVFVPKSLW